MNQQSYHQYLEQVIIIAKAAGEAIMQVYSTDFNVLKKDDHSPLTQADLAAHQVIINALSELTPHIPVLSEESEAIDYETRKAWQQYWLIDPLDGTREFVKRNGEFTVNIALIDKGESVLGVIYAPVKELLYFASLGYGAYKQLNSAGKIQIYTRSLSLKQVVVAGSRSHADERMQNFMRNLELCIGVNPELISMGSSLKICLVAEGLADVYPRLGPTSEWDTAAAHCVLKEAGGDIVDQMGNTIRYNSKLSLLNPFFFAKSGGNENWAKYI
ncbi:MAG: 3'(2'),5'-bisphosphate nucleotidase CysQ [Methylotenera sp.]|nr:3'(2'),5'-bisphosphate nucleotidase CysQ [Methylotenera sp.]